MTILLDGVGRARMCPWRRAWPISCASSSSGFAVSIVTTWWDRREALHQSRMADMTSAYAPALDSMLSSLQELGVADLAGKAAITRGMDGQAYLLASVDMFTVSVWLCLGLAGLVWLCRKARPADRRADVAD